jgi:carboxymethylenebutenolidase
MALATRTAARVLSILLMASALRSVRGQARPEEVVFPSNGLQLHGFLWRPSETGPFPAILWNHGSEKYPGSEPALAKFYTGHSYVFFVPHRRGQGRSPGPYIQDLVAQAAPFARGQRMMQLQDEEVVDVIAALGFLKSQPFVDPSRIAISGCSYGGIQTLLAGERELGVKALVPFAPGAMSWDSSPAVGDRLRRAVRQLKAPVFMIQARNDYNLAPTNVLSKEAQAKGKDFRAKIYPPYGSSHQDGHGKFCTTATDVWGSDVLAFLAEHM